MFAMVPHLKLIAYKRICNSEVGHVLYQRKPVAKTRMPVVQVLNTATVSPQNSSWFIRMPLTVALSNRLEKPTPAAAAQLGRNMPRDKVTAPSTNLRVLIKRHG